MKSFLLSCLSACLELEYGASTACQPQQFLRWPLCSRKFGTFKSTVSAYLAFRDSNLSCTGAVHGSIASNNTIINFAGQSGRYMPVNDCL
jgi:hypothetical protein